MDSWAQSLMLLGVVTSLFLLGASRFNTYIRCLAAQGLMLGAFTLLVHRNHLSIHIWSLALAGGALRGVIFPLILSNMLRRTGMRREVVPYVGFTASVLFGLAALAVSLWLGTKLPAPPDTVPPLAVPLALFMIAVGFFLIVTRKMAISQVLGYLEMENGVTVFGVALVGRTPLLVEMGVLLDVFVAVLVMGVALFHIQSEFEHMDTERLSLLKD